MNRYEELQSVSFGAVDYPTTSCSVRLTDLSSMTPPAARLPPRLMTKEDMWHGEADRERTRPQDQDWNSSVDPEPDTWDPGRDGREEELWSSGRDQALQPSQDQSWGSAGDSSRHGKADRAWMRPRSRGSEEGWAAARGQVHNQTWDLGRDPEAAGRDQDQVYGDQDRGPVWRPGRD